MLTWGGSAIALACLGNPALWLGVAVLAGFLAHLAGWASDVRLRRLGAFAASFGVAIYAVIALTVTDIVAVATMATVALLYAGTLYVYVAGWRADQ
jgi:hypothetical protein